MVLIANIRSHSMSDTRAVVFQQLRDWDLTITIHKNDNAFASRRIRQGTHIDESLSFVLHDVSHAINITSVVSARASFAVIVGQL